LICKGANPFHVDWNALELPKAIQRMADLDENQVNFLRRMTALVREKRKHCFRELNAVRLICIVPLFGQLSQTQNYDENYWFTGQLFQRNWLPSDIISESPPSPAVEAGN
jgi:hypothetical protein